MHPAIGTLTAGKKPLDGTLALAIYHNSAHGVVGCRGDGHHLAGNIDPLFYRSGAHKGGQAGGDKRGIQMAHIDRDLPPRRKPFGDGAGQPIAGLKLIGKALAVFIHQMTALTPDRLGDQLP